MARTAQAQTETPSPASAQPSVPVGESVPPTPDPAPLRRDIETLIAAGTSQAKIAREAGISGAALSAWLRDEYKGDTAAMTARLEIWRSAHRRKRAGTAALPAAPPWIETPTANRIVGVLQWAQIAEDFACVYGGAGVGKTVTLRHYAETSPNVWVAELHAAATSVAAALEEIAEAVGLRGVPTRAVRIHRELVRRLRGTGGLLCIDEAQHLRPNTLEAIRSLHDASGCGLVLCGNETVYARLTGGSRAAHFAQLFSRMGKRCHVARPADGDVTALAAAFPGAFGKKETAVLADLARRPGGLRTVVKVLRLAGMIAAGEGAAGIEEPHIRAAARDLAA